jgi:hypothetical protein
VWLFPKGTEISRCEEDAIGIFLLIQGCARSYPGAPALYSKLPNASFDLETMQVRSCSRGLWALGFGLWFGVFVSSECVVFAAQDEVTAAQYFGALPDNMLNMGETMLLPHTTPPTPNRLQAPLTSSL